MAEHGTIARPYAQAVFEIAEASGQLAGWSAFLSLAADVVLVPDTARLLGAPGARLDAVATALADILRGQLGDAGPLQGGADAPGVNFLRLLAANHRLAALPDIVARFEVLRAEAENRLDVTLTSAHPVDEAQQSRMAEGIEKRFGRKVRLSVVVDPALLGGARLQLGDRIIDGSVRTGLDKLATALRA